MPWSPPVDIPSNAIWIAETLVCNQVVFPVTIEVRRCAPRRIHLGCRRSQRKLPTCARRELQRRHGRVKKPSKKCAPASGPQHRSFIRCEIMRLLNHRNTHGQRKPQRATNERGSAPQRSVGLGVVVGDRQMLQGEADQECSSNPRAWSLGRKPGALHSIARSEPVRGCWTWGQSAPQESVLVSGTRRGQRCSPGSQNWVQTPPGTPWCPLVGEGAHVVAAGRS